MTTKLIEMNLGCTLRVLVDGKEQEVRFSATCPAGDVHQPKDLLLDLIPWLKAHLEIENWDADRVRITRTRRVKDKRVISHDEFNRRIEELMG